MSLKKYDFSSEIKISNQSSDCVIVLHGFNATPYEMHELAENIATLGVDVLVPMLPKHGVSSELLATLKLDNAVEWGIDYVKEMKKKYNRVIVIGHSLGSGLSFSIATSGIDVDGVIMTGLSRNLTLRLRFLTFLAKILRLKYIPGIFSKLENSDSISKEYISWKKKTLPKQPVALMREAVETIPNRFNALPKIKAPVMLVLGTKDFITYADYIGEFLLVPESKRKIAYILEDGYHEIFLSTYKDRVISKIKSFISDILFDKKADEELTACYVLDENNEYDKTDDLSEYLNSKKRKKLRHSDLCLP